MINENDLKSAFIVDEADYTKERIQKYAEKALKFAKISKNGQILIENHSLPTDEKIKLCLAVRLIAHNFDSSINSSASLSEIKEIVDERTEAVGSRLSKIVKSGFAKKIERGVYQITTHKIKSFLDELILREEQGPKTQGLTKKKKYQSTKGVGKDIQDLVNSNFFNTPKTIKEISIKLKEEVKFHDDRVIDATVRKGFVANKKILKRIPSTGKGKARWEYVIRQ